MPDQRYDAWIKDVFEVDPAKYAKPAGKARSESGSQNLGDDILDGLGSIGHAVVSGAEAVGGAVATGAKAVGGVVVDGAKVVGGAVVDGAKAVGGAVASGVGAVGGAIEQGATAIVDGAVSVASGSYEESMKRLDLQIKAVKDAGLDATPYEAQAKSIRADYADALKLAIPSRLSTVSDLGKRADTAAAEAEADVAKLKKSAVEGVSAAVVDMRDGAKALIDKLPKESAEKPDLTKRLADLDKSIDETGKLTDRAERAKKLKDVNKAAETLFDAAAAASTDKTTIQAVYAKAIKDRYGIEITNPANMPNTHLDQVYKMFDKVPDADVVQNKMKTLTYEPVNSDGTQNKGAAYGDATIFMGDYGDETWGYKDPATGKDRVNPTTGKPEKPNGFSISTLHELGHSVDDRFKIMAASQGKSGGGGWKVESIDTVAKVFIDEFRSGAGKSLKIDDGVLSGAVTDALSGGGVNQPDGLVKTDWDVLKPLLDLCNSRRSTFKPGPWNTPHDVGGRAYHEAYAGQWWSYDTAVRAKPLTVRNYQWRAPGEWFAELYAYTYYNSEAPPSGVDSAICAYMFGGTSASAAAPTA